MVAIYGILNTVNGKLYIGQSRNLEKRWKAEKKAEGVNKHLKMSMKKYGLDNFHFFILEECEVKDLNNRERFYIKLYHTFNPEFGYNKTSGGDTSFEYYPVCLTDEQRKKISKKAYERWANMPDEKRKEISEKLRKANLGKKLSKEHKEKIKNSGKGLKRKAGTGKNISEAKIEANRKKAKEKIRCIETGDEEFSSIQMEKLMRKKYSGCKVNKKGILNSLKNKDSTSDGFHFEKIQIKS